MTRLYFFFIRNIKLFIVNCTQQFSDNDEDRRPQNIPGQFDISIMKQTENSLQL